ncbi:MAG: hypothetical protein JNL82_28155 [Myxococcales bacterium]|nr:hypothetical protein [Myxococcales bacterium]
MLALTAVVAGGCARRLDLTTEELKKIEDRDEELKTLRVVPKRKLLSLYREDSTKNSYDVSKRKITERGAYRPLKKIIGRKTFGKVVSRTELNGMPVFWIAFDNACADTACAYGFVLTELNRWSLFQVPDREKYQPPENYRRNLFKRNRLKLVKQKSLAEANEVFAVTRKRGRVLTVDLQIRKDVYRPTRTDVERAGGAD